MKLSEVSIGFIIAAVQICTVCALFLLGVETWLLLTLLLPVFILIVLLKRLQLQTRKEIKKSLISAADAVKQLNETRQSVNKDPLTGLYSRYYIKERLEEALEVAEKRGSSCAVLYIDLDFFKEFNEALGYTLGNQVIVSVANRLRSVIKKSDILGYYGSDEFLVVLQDIRDQVGAELVARRILTSMITPFEIDGHQLNVSATVGVALGPQDHSDAEHLVHCAETALKASKKLGRKGYSFFRSELNSTSTRRMQIDQCLRGALERNEFFLVYQPIVDENGRNLKGFEVLIRWNSPVLGNISPNEFIPIAEQSGLISDIGIWVLRESLYQLKSWIAAYGIDLVMSINVSPRQFHDESIVPSVKKILKQLNVPPKNVQLEVTEGLFLNSTERVLEHLNLLKTLGVCLALDDFGTGYSSLSSLNRLPFDVVKIDKSFVDGMTTNERDFKTVRGIIALANGLELKTVVEGVETAEQVHELRKLGVDHVQGFYYSKPLSVREAESQFLSRDQIVELDENIWDKL